MNLFCYLFCGLAATSYLKDVSVMAQKGIARARHARRQNVHMWCVYFPCLPFNVYIYIYACLLLCTIP